MKVGEITVYKAALCWKFLDYYASIKTLTPTESLTHRIEGHAGNKHVEARFLYRKPQEVCSFHGFVLVLPFGAKQSIVYLLLMCF